MISRCEKTLFWNSKKNTLWSVAIACFCTEELICFDLCFEKKQKTIQTVWLDCHLNKYDVMSLTPDLTFSDQMWFDLKIKKFISNRNLVFIASNITNTWGKHQYLHVNTSNYTYTLKITRKTQWKWWKYTYFSNR